MLPDNYNNMLGAETHTGISGIERLPKTQAEFREVEMQMKLKNYWGVRVRAYQYQGQYLEEDNVWHQYQDLNDLFGPA